MRVALRTPALAILACTAVALAGCAGSDPHSPAPGAKQASSASVTTTTITIKDFKFDPPNITVSPGAKVTVKNEDSAPHTATLGGKFDTGRIAGNQTGTFTAPETAGSYDYLCTLHEYMRGKLVVK